MAILAKTRLQEALRDHPELKETLIALSPTFRKLNNPVIYRLVARWATFADVARMGGLSVCELLHRLNSAIGTEKELLEQAPECIEEKPVQGSPERAEWVDAAQQVVVLDMREREGFFLPEVVSALKRLHDGQILLVTTSFYPAPLRRMLDEQGYQLYY